MTVTFFGHRRTPDSVKPLLKETLRELIEKDRADMFTSAMRAALIGWYTIP